MAFYFDSLEFVKRIRAAGFTEEQAEGVAGAMREALSQTDAATRQDVVEIKAKPQALRTEIKTMESRIVIKVIIAIGALAAVAPFYFKLI